MIKKSIGVAGLALVVAIVLSSCMTTYPVAVTSNPIGRKMGEASSTTVLGLRVDGGDMSIYRAAQNGGITKISTVDFKTTSVFGIFVTQTTIVSGD